MNGTRDPQLPEMHELRPRRVYRLRSRNLSFGVYDGDGGFWGIRTKFGAGRNLDREWHWDASDDHGTVEHAIDAGCAMPDSMRFGYDSDELFRWLDALPSLTSLSLEGC